MPSPDPPRTPAALRPYYDGCTHCEGGRYFCACAEPELAAQMETDLEAARTEITAEQDVKQMGEWSTPRSPHRDGWMGHRAEACWCGDPSRTPGHPVVTPALPPDQMTTLERELTEKLAEMTREKEAWAEHAARQQEVLAAALHDARAQLAQALHQRDLALGVVQQMEAVVEAAGQLLDCPAPVSAGIGFIARLHALRHAHAALADAPPAQQNPTPESTDAGAKMPPASL